MRSIGLTTILFIVLVLVSGGSAMASITTIKGSLTCFLGCNKNVVQFIPQGEDIAFEVVGQFVDLSTSVEITGSGVSVSYGTRKGGSNSSIIVRFNVSSTAASGERTVKMRYAIETNGPDTFKVRVVKKGTITDIKYKRPLVLASNSPITANPNLPPSGVTFPGAGSSLSSPPTQLVEPVNIPLNQKVVLVITGSKLSGVELRSGPRFRNVAILSGGTDSRIEMEIEFTSNGQEQLLFYDSRLSQQDMNSSTSSKFSYSGGSNRTVQYGGSASGGGFISPPITGGGSTGSSTFVDAAPRANMLNIFRRQGQNPVFTEIGFQYFNAPNSTPGFCSGMSGNQSRIITIPNPVWGVSNVGTANINTAFAVQLLRCTQVLATETITSLIPGQTRDFTFERQDSRVRVFTFLARGGCFISPQADQFFEDPPFTVIVNTNGALTEAAVNQSNNIRNY
ncbi:MAG: hypothetical protein ACRD6X_11875 [Pyrinomonadaceae bacterium]